MMRPLSWSTLLLSIWLAGCAMREGMNNECEWPPEPHALDLRNHAHQRHLVDDVRVAEELGVRFNDSHLARGESRPDWPPTRDDCDTKLFAVIARSHGVSVADVRQARQRLANRWDPTTYIPLAALYVAGTFGMARRIRMRFPADEKLAAIVATFFVSVALCGFVLALGHLWGGVVEMIRLGNMHMTYRASRLGWHGYAPELFAAGVVLFWVTVWIGYRVQQEAATELAG